MEQLRPSNGSFGTRSKQRKGPDFPHIWTRSTHSEALTQKMAAGGHTLGSFDGGITTSGVTPALWDTGWALLCCSLTAAWVGWGGELWG